MFTTFNSAGVRWPGALRAALSLGIPALIALLLGHEDVMLLITAGSFSVIYGEGHPFHTRWKVMLTAGVLVAVASTAGGFVGEVVWANLSTGGTRWWILLSVLFVSAIAALGAFLQNALRLPPPGSFFIVMVAGGATMVARQGINPVEVGFWSLFGVLSGVLIGMAPMLVNPHGPEQQAVRRLEDAVAAYAANPTSSVARNHQATTALQAVWWALSDARIVRGGKVINHSQEDLVRRALEAHQRLVLLNSAADEAEAAQLVDSPIGVDLTRSVIPHARPTVAYRIYRSVAWYSHATSTAARVLVAGLLAGVISVALGLDRPDWAIVSVLLTLQWGPDRIPGTVRGANRVIGSLIGIAAFAGVIALDPAPWLLLVVLMICQFGAEIFVVRNYALTVIFTTPLALLMGGSNHLPLGEVVFSRAMEVLLASVFALLLLWLYIPNFQLKHHDRAVSRCFRSMGTLLGALLSFPPNEALAARRDLQFELLAERYAAQSVVNDAPQAAQQMWEQHLAIQHAGYHILDVCSQVDDRQLTMAEIGELSAEVRQVAQLDGPTHPQA